MAAPPPIRIREPQKEPGGIVSVEDRRARELAVAVAAAQRRRLVLTTIQEATADEVLEQVVLQRDVEDMYGAQQTPDGLAEQTVEFDDFTNHQVGAWLKSNLGAGADSGPDFHGLDSPILANGVWRATTGTTTTGRSAITKGDNPFGLGAGMAYQWRWRVWIRTLSAFFQDFFAQVGFFDQVGAGGFPIDAVMIGQHRAFFGNNWQGFTFDNGVFSVVDLGIAPVVDTPQVLDVRVDADATLATFIVDGLVRATLGTNIPKVSTSVNRRLGGGIKITKVSGTTAKTIHWDWGRLQMSRAASR